MDNRGGAIAYQLNEILHRVRRPAVRALEAEGGRILFEKVDQPRDIAQTIVYLALDDGHCTGTVLTADGGYSAH